MQFLKVTFYLQLLPNIGPVPRFVQYVLEPVLDTVVCALPLPPLVSSFSFSVSESAPFCYSR